jgi:hypothetical protein
MMNKPKGKEVAKVYSVRLEPQTHKRIVDIFGSLRIALELAEKREKEINALLDNINSIKLRKAKK